MDAREKILAHLWWAVFGETDTECKERAAAMVADLENLVRHEEAERIRALRITPTDDPTYDDGKDAGLDLAADLIDSEPPELEAYDAKIGYRLIGGGMTGEAGSTAYTVFRLGTTVWGTDKHTEVPVKVEWDGVRWQEVDHSEDDPVIWDLTGGWVRKESST